MEPARPLRDVFAGLSGAGETHDGTGPPGDPQAFLAAQGHPGLPGDLLATAIGSYAGTAPAEVAEHLAPYLAAHQPGPEGGTDEPDPLHGLHLLATAPAGPWEGEVEVEHQAGADEHGGYAHGLDVADSLDAGPHGGDEHALHDPALSLDQGLFAAPGQHALDEHALDEHGLGEHGLGEHGLGEHGLGEAGLGEAGLGEAGPAEHVLPGEHALDAGHGFDPFGAEPGHEFDQPGHDLGHEFDQPGHDDLGHDLADDFEPHDTVPEPEHEDPGHDPGPGTEHFGG